MGRSAVVRLGHFVQLLAVSLSFVCRRSVVEGCCRYSRNETGCGACDILVPCALCFVADLLYVLFMMNVSDVDVS